jgi:hypothetical protein
MSPRIKGHDYRLGRDLELSGAEWRALLSTADFTRRIGNGVLAYQRREGRAHLAFEVYDEQGAMNLRRMEQRK